MEKARTESSHFLTPLPGGRVFASLNEARAAEPAPGDVLLLRDLAVLCPASSRSSQPTRGKWRLRPYRLADGQSGKLLMVCDFAGDEGPAAVPPEFEVKLDLPGWYAIWIGAPLFLDKVQARKGRKLALSAHLAEEFYTGGDFASQKIDLDAWLATRALDFVSVEARQPEKYIPIAKRHGVPYFASQDWGVKGAFPDEDPDLPLPADAIGMHDPYPGEEFIEQNEFDKQFGLGVDPTDYDRGFAVRYAQGVDGVCLTNGPVWHAIGRMGHIEEMKQRAVTGTIWGQEPGPGITVL